MIMLMTIKSKAVFGRAHLWSSRIRRRVEIGGDEQKSTSDKFQKAREDKNDFISVVND